MSEKYSHVVPHEKTRMPLVFKNPQEHKMGKLVSNGLT